MTASWVWCADWHFPGLLLSLSQAQAGAEPKAVRVIFIPRDLPAGHRVRGGPACLQETSLAVPGDLLRVMVERAFPRRVALSWPGEEPFELLGSWFGEGAATCPASGGACLASPSARQPGLGVPVLHATV